MGIFDSMLAKYGAVMVGYAIVGLPVFGPNSAAYLESIKDDPTRITKDYVRNSSLLINLAKAIGKIVVSYKDIQNLAGYTTLIHEMDEVLNDLENGKFRRSQVT
jgi:ATP-binding cassette subfamily D (ALD) protein 3